jgi:creatinine amidohydrolase/Fe(II)-dependent formamide hydrolase-like protein
MRLLDRTWAELSASLNEHTVAVIPAGSVEQHGLHLPLGVDTYIACAHGGNVSAFQEICRFARMLDCRTLLDASIQAVRNLFFWLSELPLEQIAPKPSKTERRNPWTHP